MPDSTLNRRNVALHVAKPNGFSYPQKTAENLLIRPLLAGFDSTDDRLKQDYRFQKVHVTRSGYCQCWSRI
jgi:hypothetical protein